MKGCVGERDSPNACSRVVGTAFCLLVLDWLGRCDRGSSTVLATGMGVRFGGPWGWIVFFTWVLGCIPSSVTVLTFSLGPDELRMRRGEPFPIVGVRCGKRV